MSRPKLKTFKESGLKLSLPTKTCFRFEETDIYNETKGRCLKEMDFGWWLQNKPRQFIFLELKGQGILEDTVSGGRPSENKEVRPRKTLERITENLVKKATDVLLMMTAVWIKTEWGEELHQSLPADIPENFAADKLTFVFLIDTFSPEPALLLRLRDSVNKNLEGRLFLFGASCSCTVVNFDNGKKLVENNGGRLVREQR